VTSIDRPAPRPVGTARARAGQVVGAFAIDTASFAALAGLTLSAAVSGSGDAAILAGLALAALTVGQLRSWSRTGRTLGALVTGMRQVASADGSPPGFDRAFESTWLADIRTARDPVAVVPLPSPAAAPVETTGGATASATHRSTSRALLVVDGRVGGAIGDGVVIGRNPTASGTERAVSVADIGREISKVHLGLRVDAAGRVWAEDRKSTNGSTITRRDGLTQQLAPGRPVELTAGDIVHIGGHTVAVQFVTDVRVATR
jgi:hypothetical protein